MNRLVVAATWVWGVVAGAAGSDAGGPPSRPFAFQYRSLVAPAIVTKGTKLFNSETGLQFYAKGLLYRHSPYAGAASVGAVDPMADPGVCAKDLRLLRELGVNTVRLASVDPLRDHDECMRMFGQAGVYVLVDLESGTKHGKVRWDVEEYVRYTQVVDQFQQHSNTLGFMLGRDMLGEEQDSRPEQALAAAPFVKAAVRDVKHYIHHNPGRVRDVPLGVHSNDLMAGQDEFAQYLVCDDNTAPLATSGIDFYLVEMMRWCGDLDFVRSGYRDRTLEFQDFPVPLLLGGFGCRDGTQARRFEEVAAMFSDRMTTVWSGGVAHEYYSPEQTAGPQLGGLVVPNSASGRVDRLEEFRALQQQYARAQPRFQRFHSYHPRENMYVPCPVGAGVWQPLEYRVRTAAGVAEGTDHLPPLPLPEVCGCLRATESCQAVGVDEAMGEVLFQQVCTHTDCLEVAVNGATGEVGRFAPCSWRDRLGYALSRHHLEQGPGSCSWNGTARTVATRDTGTLRLLRTGAREPHRATCGALLGEAFFGWVDSRRAATDALAAGAVLGQAGAVRAGVGRVVGAAALAAGWWL